MGAEPIDDQTLVVLPRSEYGQPFGDTSGGIVTVPVKVGGFRRRIDETSKQDREESSNPPLLIGKTGVGMGYQGRNIRPEHGNP